MKRQFLFVALSVAATACNSNNSKNIKAAGAISVEQKADTVVQKFTPAMVDNKKDLTCGMPLTAGIGDTCHYKNKVYGFCSKECKDEFMKNPKGNLSAKK